MFFKKQQLLIGNALPFIMFLFLASTTMDVQSTWYTDTVFALMWFMIMEKDTQQIILSVTTGNTRERTNFHGHFFAK